MAQLDVSRSGNATVQTANGGYISKVTHPWVLLGDTLWYGGRGNAVSGIDTLQGVNVNTGVLTGEIETLDLTGMRWDQHDVGIDSNNYLWLHNITSTGQNAYTVVNTSAGSIVTTLATNTGSLYNSSVIASDRPNNLMWVQKNSTTLEAFSTSTYTSSHTITISADAGASFAMDEDNGKLWVYSPVAGTLKVYTSSTGTLTNTITQAGSYDFTVVLPSRNLVLISDFSTTKFFSTDTFALVKTLSIPPSDAYLPIYYIPALDWVYGYYFDDATSTEYIKFYDVTTLTEQYKIGITTADFLLYAGAVGNDNSIYYGEFGAGVGSAHVDHIFKVAFMPGLPMIDDPDSTGTLNGDGSLYTGQPDIFNRELIFDLDLRAFYIYDIGHTGLPAVVDYVTLPGFAIGVKDETIMAGSDIVLVTSGDTVIIDGQTSIDRQTETRGENFKYVTLSGTNFTLSEYRDFDFKDFVSFDGTGDHFSSYIVTGYDISQDMMRKKRAVYLLVYNERTETIYTLDIEGNVVLARQSGCVIQSQWDWNNRATQGKWGQSFQAYRLLPSRNFPTNPQSGDAFDFAERVIVTKNKLRGSGRALSLFIQAESGKDMKLLGWALDVTRQDFV